MSLPNRPITGGYSSRPAATKVARRPTAAPPRCRTQCERGSANPDDHDVRGSFAHLLAQWFWTWLTGKPAHGQQPRWRLSTRNYLIAIVASLMLSVLVGLFALHTAPIGLLLLPISWILTVHGARALQVTVVHHCAHGTFASKVAINTVVGEVISTALMIAPYPDYKGSHVGKKNDDGSHNPTHHGRDLATINDPDVVFLRILGFEPRATLTALRRHLRTRPISPSFHWKFLRARTRPNLGGPASMKRRFIAWTYVVAVLTAIALTGTWIEFLVVWVFPMTILYHVSSLWQFLSEHLWLRVDVPGEHRRITLQRLTSGRFCGEAAPGPDVTGSKRAVAWLKWTVRMLLVHLPSRLFVLAGDLPVHDWHHQNAKGDWRNGPYERQRDVNAGRRNYTEVWGLGAAVDRVLEFWSQLPPQYEPVEMSDEDQREQFGSM